MARKKQRETYGSGSVSPVMIKKIDKDGRAVRVQKRDKQGLPVWRVCVSLGTESYVDDRGRTLKRQCRKQKSVHGTLAQARKVAEQMTKAYEHISPGTQDLTFADACEAWETSIRNAGTASPNTIANYLRDLGHMRRHIGDMPLLSVTKQDVESALAAIKEERDIGNTTLRRVYAVTKRVFSYALDSDWIVRNPVSKVKAPKIDEVVDRRSLTSEECALLHAKLDEAEKSAYAEFEEKEHRQYSWGNTFGRSCLRGLARLSSIIAIRIMLASGLRRSEVLGLTWGSVDLDSGQITVKQKLIALEKKSKPEEEALVIAKPKTKTSTRTLYLGRDTLEHLKRWKEFQAKTLRLVSSGKGALRQTLETPVCVGDNGSWLHPNSLSRWWGLSGKKGFRDVVGFPDLRMHELRHTQATLLLGSGVDLKTVQARLGHAKSSHTLDLYAHAIPANDRNAADIFDSIANVPVQARATVTKLHKTA